MTIKIIENLEFCQKVSNYFTSCRQVLLLISQKENS